MSQIELTYVSAVEAKTATTVFVLLSVLVVLSFLAFLVGFVMAFRKKYKMGIRSPWFWNPKDDFKPDKDVVRVKKESGKEYTVLFLPCMEIGRWSDLGKSGKKYRRMEKAIEKVAPDLIVLAGNNARKFTRQAYERLTAALDKTGICWTAIFGDADRGNADGEYLADIMKRSEKCLFKKGPRTVPGLSNYAIGVEEEGKIVHLLVFFDTGETLGNACYQHADFYLFLIRGAREYAGGAVKSTCAMFTSGPSEEFFGALSDEGAENVIFGSDRTDLASLGASLKLYRALKAGSEEGCTVLTIGENGESSVKNVRL